MHHIVGREYWRKYYYCNQGFLQDQLHGNKVRIKHFADSLSESSGVDMMNDTAHITFISSATHKAYYLLQMQCVATSLSYLPLMIQTYIISKEWTLTYLHITQSPEVTSLLYSHNQNYLVYYCLLTYYTH